MQIHSAQKIRELKKLRKQGYSINELVTKLAIPKTTVWHHVHNVDVLPKYILILKSKRGGSTKRTQQNWEIARKHAEELLKNNKNKKFLIALAMLYWSEGSKKVCEFINTDGKIIHLYLEILRKVLNIPEKSIKPTLRIFTGMKRTTCLNHWSQITKIPKRNFLVRLNDGGTKGNTKYGMCRITVRKGSNTLKLIHSLIEKISGELIKCI